MSEKYTKYTRLIIIEQITHHSQFRFYSYNISTCIMYINLHPFHSVQIFTLNTRHALQLPKQWPNDMHKSSKYSIFCNAIATEKTDNTNWFKAGFKRIKSIRVFNEKHQSPSPVYFIYAICYMNLFICRNWSVGKKYILYICQMMGKCENFLTNVSAFMYSIFFYLMSSEVFANSGSREELPATHS